MRIKIYILLFAVLAALAGILLIVGERTLKDEIVAKADLIRVTRPLPNAFVSSPLVVEGEARGYWYFEASFPVRLFDATGRELAVIPAQAQGEWMTTEFVPFSVILEFEAPATASGVLVLEKDNPSGLPENADELRIPVRFLPAEDPPAGRAGSSEAGACIISGCSSQVCADEEVFTTCEFRPEYACLKEARCERQPSGECGWTLTKESLECLNELK